MALDVLILGDSHAAALIQGCRALDLSADGLSFSGYGWHSGRFAFDDENVALTLRDMPSAISSLDALVARFKENPFGQGVQTICSFGYQTGLMMPAFGSAGHVLSETAQGADNEIFVSNGFLVDYVRALRRPHIRLMQAMAKHGTVVAVAPPPTDARPEARPFRDAISEAMRTAGIPVYDPTDDLAGPDGLLTDPALLESDLRHGNVDYGRQVVEKLFERGFLTLTL